LQVVEWVDDDQKYPSINTGKMCWF